MNDSSPTQPSPSPDDHTQPRQHTDPAAMMGLGIPTASATDSGPWQPPDPIWLDRQLDRYTVRQILGQGGMGAVYLAWQKSLDRDVAIKLIAPTLAESTVQRERFIREGRVLAHLQHPHIVNVHDFGELPNGTLYLVMEYVPGGNLHHLIAAGPCPPEQALGLTRQLCAAVQKAHDAGVIHRDIKPGNILLTRDHQLKLADFGLVRPTGPFADQLRLTMTGTTVGTLDYIAPEIFQGANPDDPRTDVYSIGVVLYELLTGHRPRGAFPPPSKTQGVPARLDAIVRKALHADPTQRYPSAQALADALEPRQSIPFVSKPLPWLAVGITLTIAIIAFIWLIQAVLFSDLDDHPDLPSTGPVRHATGDTPNTPPSTDLSQNTQPPSPQPSTSPPTPAVTSPPPDTPASDANTTTTRAWTDLVPQINLNQATVLGTWRRPPTGGITSNNQPCIIALPQSPHTAYDVRIRFTKQSGSNSIALFLTHRLGQAHAELDAWGQHLAGLQNINGQSLRDQSNRFNYTLPVNRQVEFLVEVRPSHISLHVDGQLRQTYTLTNQRLSVDPIWQADTIPRLAIASWETPTTFHSIEYRQVD